MAIADASYIGKGKSYIGGKGVGNVSALALTHEETEISQLDYTTPGAAKRNSVRRVDSIGVSITITDFNAKNLETLLRGTQTQVTTSSITDESISAPAAIDTDSLVETANIIDVDASVTVTSDPAGTTYTDGTDYEVVGAGIVILPGGGISASDPLLVTYTSKTVDVVNAITGSAPELSVTFSGVNEAQQDLPIVLKLYKVKFSLPGDVGLIADEFGALTLEGEVLADQTKSGAGISQYYKVELA